MGELERYILIGKSRSMCLPANVDALVHLVNAPGCILEIGAYKCGVSIALAASFPDRWVWALDIFGGLPYYDRGFENFADADYEEIQSATNKLKNIHLVKGRHEYTIPIFPKQDISLIFLDSDHYESHKIALDYLWPLVSSGGSVVFHDWKFDAVQKAITETIRKEDCSYFGFMPAPSDNMGMITKK